MSVYVVCHVYDLCCLFLVVEVAEVVELLVVHQEEEGLPQAAGREIPTTLTLLHLDLILTAETPIHMTITTDTTPQTDYLLRQDIQMKDDLFMIGKRDYHHPGTLMIDTCPLDILQDQTRMLRMTDIRHLGQLTRTRDLLQTTTADTGTYMFIILLYQLLHGRCMQINKQ